MPIANFTNSETNSRIFRLTNHKPLNRYFWLKEIAETVEQLSKTKNIPKPQIIVEEELK